MRSVASILATLFCRADWFRAGFVIANFVYFEDILTFKNKFVIAFFVNLTAGFCGLLAPIGAAQKWLADLERFRCETILLSTFQITMVILNRYPSNLSGLLKSVVHLRV
jgi:hypothetical protein